MDQIKDSPELLDQIMRPAFTVENGIIADVNPAAQHRGIQADTPVSSLIAIGAEDYAAFTSGKLCLTLNICDAACNATVTSIGSKHLFCLESVYEEPEVRAFSLAAMQLREPLANAILGTDLLLPNQAVNSDPDAMKHLSQINRSLHQLLRAVCNMSDTALYKAGYSAKMEIRDAVGIFEEVLEKAALLVQKSGRKLQYRIPQQSVLCLLDAEQLERAVLNLISNAIKYSPSESAIEAELRRGTGTLIFSVWDNGKRSTRKSSGDLFSAYLREPGITAERSGIGLGMTIVHAVAAAHGGTVLIEQPNDSGLKITMTICAKNKGNTPLRSPVCLPYDYAGGRDHALVELSDALPDSLYRE